MQESKKLDFIYFDAGGGHRSAAIALKSVIESLNYPWEVRLVNLQEVLDSLDIFRKITGIRLEDIYNLALAKGWTLGSRYLLPCMHGIIRLYHRTQVKVLTEFWKSQRPDLVVSLVPNFNRALFESLQNSLPGTPMATILTDLADFPPHFWMERQKQFLICGTNRARNQAKALGYTDDRIFRTSGMILRPEFYQVPSLDRKEERKQLGLDPHLPTGLVLFGGEGSNVMFSIAQRLGDSSLDLQLFMICGHNESLRARLKRLNTRNRIVLEGFTKDVPRYMAMSDFFVGKPGPGSISEALKMNLPVVVESNAWTLPQERYNAQWIAENEFGIVLENFRAIDRAVRKLLETESLRCMKERISRMNNQAVFEIPPILDDILERASRKQVVYTGGDSKS
ncbi:MAG TPA: glycosyltransferase [Bryobacteraceae bacterium]|nr:glycosyltransferase [Bryobacteraceae bacterium]